ncbi:MAG: YbaN family protein [Bacteroidales bacterium]|nr:YbaN family protein [Bacteroidales bacterium]
MNSKPGNIKRSLLIIAGTFFVGLGILGIFLPLLPTTPLLLLAAALYSRSSGRFYNWLIHNRWFGKYISDYREGKGVPGKVKLSSITFLWLTIIVSLILIDVLWIRILLVIIAAGVTIHILLIRPR